MSKQVYRERGVREERRVASCKQTEFSIAIKKMVNEQREKEREVTQLGDWK